MKIVSIGDLVTDYYYENGKLEGVDGGMSSHNIIANLSKLGMKTLVIGVCGNDIAGQIAVKSLKDLKVDTSKIKIIKNTKTRCFHINRLIDGFTSKKKCPICLKKHWYNDSLLKIDDIKNNISKKDVLVLDNLNEINRQIISNTENRIMLDLGQYYELENLTDQEIKRIFKKKFDIINLNERVEKYLNKRFDKNILNANLIIITKGSKGAKFIFNNQTILKKLKPTKEIDSNGAGDAFFASIINDYLKEDFDIDKAYENAIKLTSKVVKNVGARGHLHKLYKVKKVKDICTCESFEMRKLPNRYSINVNNLEVRIMNALKTNAFDLLKKENFDNYRGILFTGTGGSYAAAIFASKIINYLYGTFTKAMPPRDILYQNNNKIDKVFMFSYSGTTADLYEGTKNIDNNKKIVVTKGNINKIISKTKLDKNNIISYYSNSNSSKERGFLSFEGTVVPATIFFKLYEKNAEDFVKSSISHWKNYFDNYFKENKKNLKKMLKIGNIINIFYGDDNTSAAFDIESKFTESGTFNVIMHEKKNFSHGRFINYENLNNNYNIYLKSKNISKYEEKLLEFLKDGNNIILESRYNGILAEYDLLLMVQYLTYYISNLLKIDISKPAFTENALKLFFYKGTL